MANPEHLKILKQGVKVWNKWRAEKAHVEPDLCDAYLRVADLRGIDLRNTALRYASLHRAYLRDADLRDADLAYADLRETDLYGADLRYANLGGANFNNAGLANANFFEAKMWGTVFGQVNLSRVKNLEAIIHYGPSSIGTYTIYLSRDNLPETFLRGCGVPDIFITYLDSLTAEVIEFYSCFLSHSSKDDEFAKRLYADLQNERVRCWFAPEDLKIGEKFRVRIDESIRLHDKLLLVLSEHSVGSRWVEKEVETALEKEQEQGKIVLFPVRLDDAIFATKTGCAADVRRSRHIGDFTDWKQRDSYKKGFDRLMRDLKAEANQQP